jgi:hypothetical protein
MKGLRDDLVSWARSFVEPAKANAAAK